MKNMVSAFAFVLLVIAPASALLYDFEDGAQMDEWTVTDGQGRIEGGAFILEAAGGEGKAFVGDVGWTNYTVTCKATMTGGTNNYGIIYRYQDATNYYMNGIKLSTDQVSWAARINGAYLQGEDGMRLPFDNEMQQYELKLEVQGGDFKFYVDGELVQEFSNDEFEKGAIGLRVYDATVVFDDFEVNGPGIPNSLAVEPAGKLPVFWGEIKAQ